jgi:hypothetical protein
MPIDGSKLVVREAGWSSNSNREDNSENRSAYASDPFDLRRPAQSVELGQREVPQLAQGDDLRPPASPLSRETPMIRAFPAAPV